MGIVVEFHAVDPDVVELAGSGGADPERLSAALEAARASAAAEGIGGNGPIGNGQSTPNPAEALAELTTHRGRLLSDVTVNSLASRVLWDLFASAGIDFDLERGTLQAIALSEDQANALISAGTQADPVIEAVADAAEDARCEAQWLGRRLVMILA